MNYKETYEDFMTSFKLGTTDGATVGEWVCIMTQFFTEANLKFAECDVIYNKKLSEIENIPDSESGKMPTSARAKNSADASDEGENRIRARTDIQNIEMIINSLKILQKGVLNEFSHMGNT